MTTIPIPTSVAVFRATIKSRRAIPISRASKSFQTVFRASPLRHPAHPSRVRRQPIPSLARPASPIPRARGVGPRGCKEWFTAKILKIRAKWPPLSVRFLANEHGQTDALLLPQPRVAFLWAADVANVDDEH